MNDYEHPSRDSPEWNSPDFCPFCGHELSDGGPGFIDHIEDDGHAFCSERFKQWRENVASDIGEEWTG